VKNTKTIKKQKNIIKIIISITKKKYDSNRIANTLNDLKESIPLIDLKQPSTPLKLI